MNPASHAPSENAVPSPTGKPPLAVRVAALEAEIERITRAFDQNCEAFVDSFRMVEASLHVYQRILNDMLNGTVRVTGGGLAKQVDFDSYLREYQTCLVFAEFAHWLATLQRPVPARAGDDDTIVFGGR
jgi:hypothetical protein